MILYIYGPVEESYRKAFSEILDRFQECVFYKGCVPFDQSVHVLKNSFMLLFPSVYQGEGMPGTIIDAFSAGIPVIASNWHFNERLVREGVTGYCYDWRNSGLLTERICYAVEHPDEIFADEEKLPAGSGKIYTGSCDETDQQTYFVVHLMELSQNV